MIGILIGVFIALPIVWTFLFDISLKEAYSGLFEVLHLK